MSIISETLLINQYSITKRSDSSHYTIAYIDKANGKLERRHLRTAQRVNEWLSNRVESLSSYNKQAVRTLGE